MTTRLEQEPKTPLEATPTILRLFREPYERWESYRQFYPQFKQYIQNTKHNQEHWGRKTAQVEVIENRLNGLMSAEVDQIMNLVSSISTSMAYLKFIDDFTNQGFSENQIFEFFKACLAINMRLSTSWLETLNATDQVEAAGQRVASIDFIKRNLTPLGQKLVHQNPLQLSGNINRQYASYIDRYGIFSQLLNPQFKNRSLAERIKLTKTNLEDFYRTGRLPERVYGITQEEGMPDWLDNEGIPQKVEVEAELEEDKKNLKEADEQIIYLFLRRKFLETALQEKKHKALQWINDRWIKLWPGRPFLEYILLYLNELEESEEKTIRTFSASRDRLSDPQTLSLFIEQVFKAASLITDHKIEPDAVNILKDFIAALKPEASLEDKLQFRTFREVNKQGFNALNFDLGGFVRSLSDQDLQLFGEFLEDSKGDAVSIIEFLADLLSERLKEIPIEDFNIQPLKESGEKYQQVLRKFLRLHWRVCFKQFQKLLYPDLTLLPEEVISTVSDQETPDLTKITEEFDKDVSEVEHGSLIDWQVYYALNLERPQDTLIDIPGQNLNDKAQFLNNFFVQYGISCSIKPDSVIAALDWKTRYPSEQEALVPIKTVGEEDWKKIKRGAVRIFYQRDVEGKKLNFHVHQKKAWLYGF